MMMFRKRPPLPWRIVFGRVRYFVPKRPNIYMGWVNHADWARAR